MSPASKKRSRAKSSGETTTCPWCSATVPIEAATCPSCGASLRDAAEGDILGVTQVDPAAVVRTTRIRPRNIAAFLGVGDGPADEEPTGKVEPPSEEVRREMLRLELAAIDVEIEAKAKEAAAQQALPPDQPGKAGSRKAGSGKAEPD
jgi:hypothetical protein